MINVSKKQKGNWELSLTLEYVGTGRSFAVSPFSEHKRVGGFLTMTLFQERRTQKSFNIVTGNVSFRIGA